MVFRKENKSDAFQRQISALRQQLGGSEEQTETTYEGTVGDRYPAESLASSSDPAAAADRGGSAYSFGNFGASTASESELASPSAAMVLTEDPADDAQTSVISFGTIWKGELDSEGSIHVHGRLEGGIRARHDVYIAEEADVDATITATNVIIAGLIKGTIRCSARFEVLPQGRVSGDVQAPTLVVHEGATVNGQFRMGAGEPPAENQAPTVVQRRATRGTA